MAGWIEYDSNNSGGSFWLKDKDWKALEDAGWHVQWIHVTSKSYGGKTYESSESGRRYGETWEEATAPFKVGDLRWTGSNDETIVATASSYDEAVALREKHGGYFGCLAVSACKQGESASELVSEFESVTNQDASDEGCNCCGPPHSFEWHDDDGTELVWS